MNTETADALGVQFASPEEAENIALFAERTPDDEGKLTSPIQSDTINPRLEMRDGQFVFMMTNEAGGLVERYISAAQVRHAFTGVAIDSSWLPPNIVRWGNGMVGEWAVGFIPPHIHELEVTREARNPVANAPGTGPAVTEQQARTLALQSEVDRIRVPLPGLVWFGISTQYWLWAVKTEALNPSFEIFRAPLPNIYADGSICWGEVKPERMTAKTLFKAYDLFMGTTFNNHLATAKSKSQRDDVRVKLRELGVPQVIGTGRFCECGDRESMHEFYEDHAECSGPNCVGKDEPCGFFNAGPVPMPVDYPVDDLIRQVEHTGLTLDQAIKSYFESGVIPS